MAPQAPPLDIVTVLVALSTLLFGADIASIVGPYTVILLGALFGGAWSASRRPPSSRVGTLLYLAMVVVLALIATVPLAEVLARYAGLQQKWMLGPVAVVIGSVGPDWPLEKARQLFKRWAVTGRVPDINPPGDQP